MEKNPEYYAILLCAVAIAEFPKEKNLLRFIARNAEEMGTEVMEEIAEKHLGTIPETDYALDYLFYIRKHIDL